MLDGARGDAEGRGDSGHFPARPGVPRIAQEQGAGDGEFPGGGLAGFGEPFQVETFRSGEFDLVAWRCHATSLGDAKKPVNIRML